MNGVTDERDVLQTGALLGLRVRPDAAVLRHSADADDVPESPRLPSHAWGCFAVRQLAGIDGLLAVATQRIRPPGAGETPLSNDEKLILAGLMVGGRLL